MTSVSTDFPIFRAYDAEGNPLVGGQLFTYQAGTTTPLTTYADAFGQAANPNPVILDSTGSAVVYLAAGLYKFVLEDVNNVQQWSQDNVYGAAYVSPALQPVTAAATLAQALALLGGVTVEDITALLIAASVPPGTLHFFTGAVAPSGYILADGSLVTRAQYPNLWAMAETSGNILTDTAWETAYTANTPNGCGSYSSGDGSTTFRLPDLQGQFIRAYNAGSNSDPDQGRGSVGSYQVCGIQPHTVTSTVTDPGHSHVQVSQQPSTGYTYDWATGSPLSAWDRSNVSTSSSTTGITVASSYTADANETRPYNIAYLCCIKT